MNFDAKGGTSDWESNKHGDDKLTFMSGRWSARSYRYPAHDKGK